MKELRISCFMGCPEWKEDIMKQRNILGFFSLQAIFQTPAFVFLTALFLCGAIAGSFTGLMSGRLDGEMIERLADTLVAAAGEEQSLVYTLITAIGGAILWQAGSVLCGMLRPASLFLSALCAARGFSFAFSVAALLTALGTQGAWVSLAAGGLSAVATIPCLLLSASAAFLAAREAPHGRGGGYFYALGRYRGALALCLLIAICAAGLRIPATVLLHRLGG